MAIDPNQVPEWADLLAKRAAREVVADSCNDIAPDNIVTNANVQGAINMARTYLNTANASITDNMTKNMIKALIQIVFFMVRKILLPGYN